MISKLKKVELKLGAILEEMRDKDYSGFNLINSVVSCVLPGGNTLLSFHAIGYFVAWGAKSLRTLLSEVLDGLPGQGDLSPGINNAAGLAAWLVGLVIWRRSTERARRRDAPARSFTPRRDRSRARGRPSTSTNTHTSTPTRTPRSRSLSRLSLRQTRGAARAAATQTLKLRAAMSPPAIVTKPTHGGWRFARSFYRSRTVVVNLAIRFRYRRRLRAAA